VNVIARLLPDVANPVLQAHWTAAARGELAIPFCEACGAPQWPPRPNCLVCHSFDLLWRPVEPQGNVFSYFTAHKALHPSLVDELPYAAAVVILPIGVKMLGRLVGVDAADIRLGMPVRSRFVERAPGVTLVFWEPDESGLATSVEHP
jgi:uncharacterized OB-fold protein